jgi:hypothetical protein
MMREQVLDIQKVREASPKQLTLASIALFVSLGVLIFLFLVLSGHISGVATLAWLVVAALVWVVLIALVVLFLERNLALVVFTGVLAAVLILFVSQSIYAIIGAFALYLGLLHAYRNAEKEREVLIPFSPLRILRRTFPPLFLGLSVFLAMSYHSFLLEDIIGDTLHISQDTYNVLFWPVETTLDATLPGYQAGMSLGAVEQLVIGHFGRAESLARIGGAQNINVQFVPAEFAGRSLNHVTLTFFNNNIQSLLMPYRDVLPLFFMVGLFFVFQFLSFPFRWFALGMTLLAIKVISLYNITIRQERRVIKEERVLE